MASELNYTCKVGFDENPFIKEHLPENKANKSKITEQKTLTVAAFIFATIAIFLVGLGLLVAGRQLNNLDLFKSGYFIAKVGPFIPVAGLHAYYLFASLRNEKEKEQVGFEMNELTTPSEKQAPHPNNPST